MREVLGGDSEEAPWRLLEDPGVGRGGCRVESQYSRVDATVEGRLQAVFAQVLGGERSEDAGSPEEGSGG